MCTRRLNRRRQDFHPLLSASPAHCGFTSPCGPRPSLAWVHCILGAIQQEGISIDCGPASQAQSTYKSAGHVLWAHGFRSLQRLHTLHNAHTNPLAHVPWALAFKALHGRQGANTQNNKHSSRPTRPRNRPGHVHDGMTTPTRKAHGGTSM